MVKSWRSLASLPKTGWPAVSMPVSALAGLGIRQPHGPTGARSPGPKSAVCPSLWCRVSGGRIPLPAQDLGFH